MKKIIVIFLFLVIIPGVLFAVPVPGDSFFDVNGEVLSESQMENVEGEGLISFFTNAILGAVVGGVYASLNLAIPGTDYSDPGGAANSILDGMLQGALGGITVSFMIPI